MKNVPTVNNFIRLIQSVLRCKSWLFSGSLVLCLSMGVIKHSYAATPIVFLKQNSAPKYFESHRDREGLCDQVYLSLKDKLPGLAIKIDQRLYPIKRILSFLENGSAHVFCGAGRNKEREKKYIYSTTSVYDVSNVVIAHKEEEYVPSTIAQLGKDNSVVGAYFGTSSAKFLKKHKGVKVMDKITSLSDALKLTASKTIRFFYYHDLGLTYLVRESNLPVKLIETKFRTVPQWLIYSPHLSNEYIQMLEGALKQIDADGSLKRINDQFL